MTAFVGNDERPLELTGCERVDAEVGRELHRAPDALRDVHERAVREDGRVQGGEEIVVGRHDRADVLPHQVGVLLDGLGDRQEDHPVLLELFLERRRHRHAVEHRVDGDTGQPLLFLKRDTQLLEGLEQLRVHFVEALRTLGLLGSRVVVDRLVVDGRIRHIGPRRLGHLEPVPIGLEPPLEHPVRLALLLRNEPDDVLVEPSGGELRLDVGGPAVLVGLLDVLVDCRRRHSGLLVARRASTVRPAREAWLRDGVLARIASIWDVRITLQVDLQHLAQEIRFRSADFRELLGCGPDRTVVFGKPQLVVLY